jgi:phospholipid/cholesterol/gamma-HCH transport system permease protein
VNGTRGRKPFQIPILSHIFEQFVRFFETVGKYALFFWRIVAVLFKRPYRFRLFLDQFEKIGAQSVGIIALSSLAIGMIFTLQIIALMARFQAEVMVGAVVASTLARELAPVITTLMLIAKNGSSMTAEIGTMKVTEQIDAMETMSVDPVHYLVVPRVFASIIAFPVLTGLANVVGILGSYAVAVFIRNVDPGAFLDQLYRYIDARDIYSGLIKAAVMGLMVASICSYFGFNTKRGSRGVGEAATTAVVTSSVSILIADYIMSDIMIKVFYNIKFAV